MRRVAWRLAAASIIAVAFSGLSGSAWAHRAATGRSDPDGAIIIPNLSHGQMSVIAANKAAVMDLASRQIPTDSHMRRLEGFISLQSFACMWGLMPGSVGDEASPFNECAHAYLAATRALLLHLQDMPGHRDEAQALVKKIQTEMLRSRTALVLCQYSDEPFNTAELIAPHWAEIPRHPPTALTLAGIAVSACGTLGFALGRKGGRASPGATPA